jgi:hypothetical protein
MSKFLVCDPAELLQLRQIILDVPVLGDVPVDAAMNVGCDIDDQSLGWTRSAPGAAASGVLRQSCYRPRPAASAIKSAISSGWEISARWLAFTSMVLAPIRLAMKRWRSGLIVRSSVETA